MSCFSCIVTVGEVNEGNTFLVFIENFHRIGTIFGKFFITQFTNFYKKGRWSSLMIMLWYLFTKIGNFWIDIFDTNGCVNAMLIGTIACVHRTGWFGTFRWWYTTTGWRTWITCSTRTATTMWSWRWTHSLLCLILSEMNLTWKWLSISIDIR